MAPRRAPLLAVLLALAACAPEPPDVAASRGAATVCPTGTLVEGVDVSSYQGDIDWPTFAASSGKAFAITRVSDGLYLDPKFDTFWPQMQAAGILRGAYQLYRPTQDIAAQIAEMQAATDQSVGAIEAIRDKIHAVERISAIIASAVHEQGASTQEIVRSTRSAAEGTSSMSDHVGAVAKAVGDVGDSVESVVRLAQDLDSFANRMRGQATDFASVLNSAHG